MLLTKEPSLINLKSSRIKTFFNNLFSEKNTYTKINLLISALNIIILVISFYTARDYSNKTLSMAEKISNSLKKTEESISESSKTFRTTSEETSRFFTDLIHGNKKALNQSLMALNQSKETSLLDLRPWIGVDQFQMNHHIENENKHILDLRIKFRNFGKTPAINVLNRAKIISNKPDLTMKYLLSLPNDIEFMPVGIDIFPNSGHSLDLSISPTLQSVYLFGQVRYEDSFNRVHDYIWCYESKYISGMGYSSPLQCQQ